MREATLTRSIKVRLLREGWFVIKLFGNAMQMSGLPDLLCLKAGSYIWIEVKTPEGRLSGRQKWIHTLLRERGAIVHVVRSLEDLGEVLCTASSTTSTPSGSTTDQGSILPFAPRSTES